MAHTGKTQLNSCSETQHTNYGETQQNFKALVTNPDTESDRNLGLALVHGPLVIFGGHLRMLRNEHLRR